MKRWLFAPIIAGALTLILASYLTGIIAARAQEQVQVRIDSIDTSAYPRLRASLTVVDGSGRPIVGLAPQAFAAEADGQSLPLMGVTTALDANVPAAVVLTFDTSGSMQGTAIEQAKAGGKALVNQLGPNDRVAVITFSNAVQVVQGFTSDRGALAAAIDGIVAAGNTALYDGVVAGVNTAAQAGTQRRAVVLLSDGKDSGGVSASDRSSSLAAAQTAGAPFFVVGLGEVDQAYLQELANVTKGQLFLTPSPEALQGLYETIGQALRNQYILDLDAASVDPASARTLRVQVNTGAAVASAEAPLDLSAFVVTPAPTAAPTAPPTPVATPVSETEGGGVSPVLLAAAGLATAAVLAGGGIAFTRQRRRRAAAMAQEAQGLRRPATAATRPTTEAAGPVFVGKGPAARDYAEAWLEVIAPQSGERYAIGEEPVTVGFTGDCTICLPDGSNRRFDRFRVWRREGRYMLHNLSRFGGATIGGKPVPWAVLEDGDEIQLGEWRLVFRTVNRDSDT